MHDILEDTDTTVEDLLEDGIPEKIVNTVKLLTRTSDETYHEYLEKLKPNPIAKEVKLADLADNLNLNQLNTSVNDSNSSLIKCYKKVVAFLES
ncbi:hypothetical protein [Companilactobacillus sp. FL22-1]|uniref:hypothetical protein n=1 Tax=Companilactobacillus sp. FL22-1 TaxID=3373892 RepID=UPI0037551CBF